MQHSLALTLMTRKLEGIVTCEDHDECAANALIKADAKEMGAYSEYPDFLDWYAGPVTPVRSGAINLELFDRFVKWSFVEETASVETGLVDSSESRLFYAPVFDPDFGIVHKLKAGPATKETQEDLDALEESLIGFIPTYQGVPTDYRPGFIRLIQTGRGFWEEADLHWTYDD